VTILIVLGGTFGYLLLGYITAVLAEANVDDKINWGWFLFNLSVWPVVLAIGFSASFMEGLSKIFGKVTKNLIRKFNPNKKF
jgi:hypothetical protein